MKDSKYKIMGGVVLVIVVIGSVIYNYNAKPKEVAPLVELAPATITVHQISLYEDRVDPNELIIKLDDQVQFNSKDGRSHNISKGKGNDYGHEHEHTQGAATTTESGSFGADEGYLVSFSEIGTYYFHDHYDPEAFITILVYEEK